MIKNKYLLFLSFFIGFLFWGSGLVFALEAKLPGLKDNPTLPEYVKYLFTFGISLAAILALISFTVGAVQLIISGDSPETSSNAKDRMKGSVLGLVLALSSFLILQTINPELLKLHVTPVSEVSGVFYTNGKDYEPVGWSISDIANRSEALIKGGFDSIIYKCAGGDNGKKLLIIEYPKPRGRFENDLTTAKVVEKNCGESEKLTGIGSVEIKTEIPGVQYCMGACSTEGIVCQGYMSNGKTTSSNVTSSMFDNGKIKSVRIVNDPAKGIYYGVIFHKNEGLKNGGECTLPIINTGNDPMCQNVNMSVSAVDIFQLNKDIGASGNGVNFYSKANGWNTVENAGFLNIEDSMISTPNLNEDASQMCFDYTNVNQPDKYQYKCTNSMCHNDNFGCNSNSDCYDGEVCNQNTRACEGENGEKLCSANACETFQDCPGAIKIIGNYVVAIYSKDIKHNNALYCETFLSDVKDLGNEQFIAPGSSKIDNVYIIPIK